MKNYADKVFGCWLGKCLGGNIGAPYEGMKQRMPVSFTKEFVEKMIPNDDLDLQILWLDVMKERGLDFNMEDLADAFYRKCPYAPGEYAYFKRNYEKNIMPPLSGSYNNEFYHAGMGSPIRSEIWACLFPYEIDCAIEYAKMDSVLDHDEYGDSYYGEIFLTALECLCFVKNDPYELVRESLTYIPENCPLAKTIADVMEWCAKDFSMEDIQTRIIRRHGHSESCMARQNIGFLLAAFLKYGLDFKTAVEQAVTCGFDADCTGATLGSVIGILLGGKKLLEIFGVPDMYFKLGVESPMTDCSASALTKEVCDLSKALHSYKGPFTRFTVIEECDPTIGFGETKTVTLRIRAPKKIHKALLQIKMEDGVTLPEKEFVLSLKPEGILSFPVTLQNLPTAKEGICGEVYYEGSRIGRFGLAVKRPWRVYGPYWKNEVVFPALEPGEKYSKYLPQGNSDDEKYDHKRLCHLSSLPDFDRIRSLDDLKNEPYEIAASKTDIVRLNDCTGFHGNAVYYFTTAISLPEEKVVDAQFGRNIPFAVYLNGEKIAEKDGNETFYYEVRHRFRLTLKKGVNTLTFMVVNNTDDGKFSFEFVSAGPCSDQYSFDVVNLK